MTREQEIDRAMADGFFLALTMAAAKGFPASWNEMFQFLTGVADGTVIARNSIAEDMQQREKMLGRSLTEQERRTYLAVVRSHRGPAVAEDLEVATRILRDLQATGAVQGV